ncbi:DUF4410 domain-containing protein [Granulosicoccus antarcticus]|uniref:DUF4410 domain-containing protein n=1 Tax=Granulosicoccus antarcticus IMCC3135 TaxID=1192854 RepID=A0A2Z2P878_9GAMM|nr:DUF4410 domain-containing protein [Granulosicoccus antarcticus]ASJ76054.1 hypothetical protein IMCC3135_30025 [Granulosicoccus antarcticus IMCC3135]
MKRRTILSLVLVSAFITACGSNSDVQLALPATDGTQLYQIANISSSAADVPDKFESNLRKYLEKDLKKKGMLATGNAARKVDVTITEFKMSKGVSRILLGGLAGKDSVQTKINVIDTASNKSIGISNIESTDGLAGGGPELFTSNHAKAISKFLQGK